MSCRSQRFEALSTSCLMTSLLFQADKGVQRSCLPVHLCKLDLPKMRVRRLEIFTNWAEPLPERQVSVHKSTQWPEQGHSPLCGPGRAVEVLRQRGRTFGLFLSAHEGRSNSLIKKKKYTKNCPPPFLCLPFRSHNLGTGRGGIFVERGSWIWIKISGLIGPVEFIH